MCVDLYSRAHMRPANMVPVDQVIKLSDQDEPVVSHGLLFIGQCFLAFDFNYCCAVLKNFTKNRPTVRA